ncbi:MAG: hypothetical protein V4547_14640 [Bacteroidota bacterium]
MKFFSTIFIILTFVTGNLFSQKGTIKVVKPKKEVTNSILETKNDTSERHYLFEEATISYEQNYFLEDFQNQLKPLDKISFQKPCDFVSFGYFGQLSTSRSYSFAAIWTISYLIPSTITINDSVKEKLKGFNYTLSIAGQNIIRKKNIGLFLTEGIKGGRLKLVDEQQKKIKNSLFGPFVGLVLRTTVSYITIFTSGQFCYDISSTKWKPTWFSKGQNLDISTLRQNGFTFTIGISYSLDRNYSR